MDGREKGCAQGGDAICRHTRRGVDRTAHGKTQTHEIDDRVLLAFFDKVAEQRNVVANLGVLSRTELDEVNELLIAQPVRMGRGPSVPRVRAALHLASLDGDIDVSAALVAAHDLE